MSATYFYIKYRSGRCTQIEFKTQAAAKKAYNLYSQEPELEATGWGWEVKCEPPPLSQKLRTRRAEKVEA